jgi:hypothetical protein
MKTRVAESTSASELRTFEPLNGLPLASNNFGLPNKSDGHDAHSHNTYGDNKGLLRFGSR